MAFRIQPNILIIVFSLIGLLLSGVTSLWGLNASAFTLNESQVLYMFSTTAQVLAAIYGLTLTGFVFFRNELSREESEDETLSEAVESLKTRYSTLLAFITLLVLLTFALSNLAISSESGARRTLNVVLINSGQTAFAVSLLAIVYFIFDVISPRRIELTSKALQDKVDPAHGAPTTGSLEDFLRNYNQIEALLSDYGYSSNITSSSYSSNSSRRTSNARLAEVLVRNGLITKELYLQLRNLITLRNSIIHGAEPVVSDDFVTESSNVLLELRESLNNRVDTTHHKSERQ